MSNKTEGLIKTMVWMGFLAKAEGHPRYIKDKQGALVRRGAKVAYASANDGLVFAEVVGIDEEFPGLVHMEIKTDQGKVYAFISERGDFLKLVLK